ncbi:MAG: hypothetical protein ACOC2W_01100 [bacterium]
MFFANDNEAFHAIIDSDKRKQLTTEEYNEAFDRILKNNIKLTSFIKYEYWKNDYEFQRAKEMAILKKLVNPLIFLLNNYYMTLDEIKEIEKLCLNDSKASKEILINYNCLTKENRKIAINNIIYNNEYVCDILYYNKGLLSNEEILYIIKQYSSKKHINNLKNIFYYLPINTEARFLAFSIIVSDESYILYQIENYNSKFTDEEKMIIHDIYEDKMFSEERTKYKGFIDYCLRFKNCLSYREQKLLTKKIIKKGDLNKIKEIYNKIDFLPEFNDQLNGLLVAEKLFNIE